MRKTLTRLLATVLCLCLLAGMAGAADYTQSILAGELTLSDGVTLQSGVLATGGRSDKAQTVRENVLLYTGEKAVKPIVAYGSTLYGRSSMKQTATYLDDNDLALVAGVNGAFFDMHNGVPSGWSSPRASSARAATSSRSAFLRAAAPSSASRG